MAVCVVQIEMFKRDSVVFSQKVGFNVCDEWGGAESRGNGARPVE